MWVLILQDSQPQTAIFPLYFGFDTAVFGILISGTSRVGQILTKDSPSRSIITDVIVGSDELVGSRTSSNVLALHGLERYLKKKLKR